MAITSDQKLDYLWKKIGFSATKTDVESIKGATNEAIPSPLLLRADKVWQQSSTIPSVKPANSTATVQIYRDNPGGDATQTVECTEDNTSSPRRTWRTGSTDWIPPEFGSTYLVRVYVDDPGQTDVETGGTQLFGAGSGNDDEWFFDYSSGTLNFIGTNLPSSVTAGKAIYIVGARYTGTFGVGSGSGGGDGVTYLAGNGIAISNANVISVNALSTITVGGIISTGNVTAANLVTTGLVEGLNAQFTNQVSAANVIVSNQLTTDTLTATGNATISGQLTSIEGLDANLEATFRSNVNILGNLIVTGNTVNNDVATVSTDDLTILLANNAPGLAQTDGAGILVYLANANITYNQQADVWESTKGFRFDGAIEPFQTNVYDIGSDSLRFANLYLSGNVISPFGSLQTSAEQTIINNNLGGNVVIQSNTGNTVIISTNGNTVISSEGEGNTIIQTTGNGGISITSNTVTELTSEGNTTITSTDGTVTVSGNDAVDITSDAGDITLTSETGNINLYAGSGNLYFGTNTELSNIGIVASNTTFYGNVDIQGVFTVNGAPVQGGGGGGDGTIGTPTDVSYEDGALLDTFSANTSVADAVDALNEALRNVANNTFVRAVNFTGSPLSGGAGITVTLTIQPDGNANRYDVTWGDGTQTLGATSTTLNHVYSDNSQSPFDVTVRAYNNGGSGTGSEATRVRTDYITLFTADPTAAFSLFRGATGGTALSGNNLFVTEGNVIYLDNDTTNTANANVTYSINWGDSNTDAVASDSADGGVFGNRASHTYGTGSSTGTGTTNVVLTLLTHDTASQNILPLSAQTAIKIYDPGIAQPNGLSKEAIAFTGSTGNSPRLASGATDQTGANTTLTAGATVSRTTAASGTVDSSITANFSFSGNTGTISAVFNEQVDGSITFTNGNDVGTNGAVAITEESDYNLLNADGQTIAFAQSIYYPGLFNGYKARVSKSASQIGVGINKYRLTYNGQTTNTVEFVKDQLTTTPTTTAGSVGIGQTVNYRFVSGIPYFTTGSQMNVSGATVTNLVGQTYTTAVNPISVRPGTNFEGTTENAVGTNLTYTFAQIDGGTTMLSGGVPIANTGVGSSYILGNLTVPVTSSSVRTIQSIGVRGTNVNGDGTQTNSTVRVQVHTAPQSGISEIAMAVASALGNGTYTDNAVRTFALSNETTNTPAFNSGTNYYTAVAFTEGSDPGVQGTQEATIRLGVLRHDITDYSSLYLPAGPDRSGDTGTQYATFVFRRQVVSNFTISITAPNGVAGVWIAAPGTDIDSSSTINGWLDCGAAYAGSGLPGADTGNNGNGSNGCAATTGDRIVPSTALSGTYTMTLGTANLSDATGNACMIRIALTTGQTVTALSIS